MLNWNEIEKRNAYTQPKIPALPKATKPNPPRPTPQLTRNATGQTSITPEQQAKNTQTFLAELKSKQGVVTSAAAGVGAGLTGGGRQYMAPETRQEIESNPALNRAFTGGQIAGSIPGFAAPYAAASKPITAAVSKLPAIAKMSPIAQKIAGSVATDLAVGLPLNVNYALNSEGLRGKDAVKSIALNTGIDVATGGLIEGLPAAVKLVKNADNKIPVLVNGKVVFTDAPVQATSKNIPAPLPRAIPNASKNIPTPKIVPKASDIPVQATDLPVQPRNNVVNRSLSKQSQNTTAQPEGLFVDYYPDRRAADVIKSNDYHPVSIEESIDPEEYITVYRGAPNSQKSINNGDWVTTSRQLAQDYSGGGNVISEKIQAKYLYAPKGEGIDELIYSTNKKINVGIGRPKALPKATDLPVQPRTPESGITEQAFAKNGDLPKDDLYKKTLYKTAIDEYDRTVASVADYIANYKPKGVDVGVIPINGDELMRDGGIRYAASKNDLWYQDFYKANGKKPTKAEAKELADKLVKESLRRGKGEFYNPDLGSLFNELKGLNSVGADTFKGDKSIDDLVNEFGAIPQGMAPRRNVRNGVEIKVPKKTPYGDVSQFARTFQESKIVKDDLAKLMDEAILSGSATKTTVGNKTVVDNANDLINKSIDDAYTQFKSVVYSGKSPTSQDIALGARLVQELQNMGQNENALDIGLDMIEILSESGRNLQAAQIIKRLSPEGRIMAVARVAKKISKTIGGKKVTVSDETMDMIRNAKTEGEIIRANQRAAIEMFEQVPANWADKANAWRYTAMLFNPKTHARNIVGNALFIPARYVKNIIGAGLEKAIIRNGEKTKSVLNVFSENDRELMKFARNDFKNEMKDVLRASGGGKLDNVYRPQEATVYGKGNLNKALMDKKGVKSKVVSVGNMYLQLFKNGKLLSIPGETMEIIRKLNIGALDIEDAWFMQWAYDGSFAQYMKANGLKPADMTGAVLQNAREYAGQEALKATYRDANTVATAISQAQRNLAKGTDKNGILNFGMKAAGMAIEGLVPFKRTPLNILKRAFAYSPANLIRGVVNMTYGVRSGKVTATEAIDQLASGISGTAGLMGLGAWLGFTGLVSGKNGDWSDKITQYEEMLGAQNYSLNIDGKSYTLDWAAPNSLPFFVGVEIAKSFMEEGTSTSEVANILNAITQIGDPMINLSMLKGLNDIVKTNMSEGWEGASKIGLNVATGYLGQYVPTLGGQIARTTDTTRRSTISTAGTMLEREVDKFAKKQLAKLPMASKQLEPYIDLWGREQKNGTAIENFLSPGYFKQENITPVDKELQSLIGKLDKETAQKIVPASTAYEYDLTSNSVSYRMTEKESTAYQKTRGQESYKGLNKLFSSVDYRRMNNEEKAKAIQDVYSAAGQKAKYEYFDNKGLPVTLALSTEYQEKYDKVKGFVSDKQFYTAVESIQGKSKDLEKAYAIGLRLPKASDKLYSSLGISDESVSRAKYLRQVGVTAKQIDTSYLATKNLEGDKYINSKGNESSISAGSTAEKRGLGKSSSLKKKEAIDQIQGLTDAQRWALYDAFGVSEKVW
jgi:hypothetical protein